jgi:hypothetical protein
VRRPTSRRVQVLAVAVVGAIAAGSVALAAGGGETSDRELLQSRFDALSPVDQLAVCAEVLLIGAEWSIWVEISRRVINGEGLPDVDPDVAAAVLTERCRTL